MYVINFNHGGYDTGMVSNDNQPVNSLDFAKTFKTKKEANIEMNRIKDDWKYSMLSVSKV